MRTLAAIRATPLLTAIIGCGAPPEVKAPSAAPQATSAPAALPEAREPARDPMVGPDGERAEIGGTRVKITAAGGGEEIFEPADLHPAPGDRGLRGISPTALSFLDDGTLLVGSADGTVAAIRGGRRRHSLGFRGSIRGLVPASEGVVVTTALGVIALITAEGKVRWERQITAEPLGPAVVAPHRAILAASQRGVFALSPSGEILFSHASPQLYRDTCNKWGYECSEYLPTLSLDGDVVSAGEGLKFRLDDPHPPVPSLAPTYPLTFRKVLDETVTAVLAGGPGEIWALVKKAPTPPKDDDPLVIVRTVDHGDEFVGDRYELVHVEGSRITRFKVPREASKTEVFVANTRADKGPFHFDGLVAGPDGAPWIVARRINWERTGGESGFVGALRGIGQFLEARGTAVRERRDFFGIFSAHLAHGPVAVSPEAPVRFFCFGGDDNACASLGKDKVRVSKPPGRIVSMHRIGAEDWMSTPEGKIFRGEAFTPVAAPDGAPIRSLGGVADNDVWGATKHRWSAPHWDGSRWTSIAVPAESIDGFVARAADDVWLRNGRAHWDGKQWSRVFGAPPAAGVIARGPDDVWIGGEGLFQGSGPGPAVVRLPAPATDEGAIPEPAALALGAPDAGYAVQRMRIAIGKDAPLTEARNISASPDGVLWLQTWDRLVELDGDKATTLRRVRHHPFERWAVPTAAGRGFILDKDELARLHGRALMRESVQLEQHRSIAIDADKGGSVWLVGMPMAEGEMPYPYELSPHALVRAESGGFRPVIGIPSAAWCAVAAAPDGGAFFAGGLNAGPAGEGILFHARGRLGGEATARFRAAATLLAVAAATADEAWAVGAAGTVIRVRAGAAERYLLPSGEWLRAVLAVSPNDVWIGGDEGTLLHFDGRVFHPVAHGLDAHASITGLAFAGGAVWAVGPSGIVKITRKS